MTDRTISSQIWNDQYFELLTPAEKVVFIYLFSNESTNISGLYQIKLKSISTDTGITIQEANNILIKFSEDGKAFFDNGLLFMPRMAVYQKAEKLPNFIPHLKKCYKNLYKENNIAFSKFLEQYKDVFETKSEKNEGIKENHEEIQDNNQTLCEPLDEKVEPFENPLQRDTPNEGIGTLKLHRHRQREEYLDLEGDARGGEISPHLSRHDKPTLEQVLEYANSVIQDKTESIRHGTEFFDIFNAQGWTTAGQYPKPIIHWQSKFNTWHREQLKKEIQTQGIGNAPHKSGYQQRLDYKFDAEKFEQRKRELEEQFGEKRE